MGVAKPALRDPTCNSYKENQEFTKKFYSFTYLYV